MDVENVDFETEVQERQGVKVENAVDEVDTMVVERGKVDVEVNDKN